MAAVRAGVPALNMPMTHGVGPLTVPGQTACISCAWAPLQAANGVDARGAVGPTNWTERGLLAALAPRQAVSGGLAAGEAAVFLSGGHPRTLGGVAYLDIEDYTGHRFLPTPRNSACEVCGAGSRVMS
jgi:bacteriocin biosynthesis cyclodehydratase domain-containing protein